MEPLREKYALEATNARAQLPQRFMALEDFMSKALPDPTALATEFTIAPSASGEVPTDVNPKVQELLHVAQSELFFAVQAFGVIISWLKLSIPQIEDGNNFGVGIVMEAAKMVTELRKEMEEMQKALPEYHKERGAAVEKVIVKQSNSVTNTSSKKEGSEGQENSVTDVQENKTVASPVLPDQLAYITSVDVSWYLRLYATCDRVRSAYATVCDFLEKNEDKIQAPKGMGGGMSMF